MIPLLSRMQLRLGHVSDETLAGFLSGELSSLRAMRVNNHLGRCWQCRARREELERAALLVVEYRRGNQASCLPLDPNRRRSFVAKVEEAAGKPEFVTRLSGPIRLLGRRLRVMNPVFASVVILAVAGVLLVWIWQRSATTVTAGELLRRAEASEAERPAQHQVGVLYQEVAVRVGTATIHHTIYRDLSGQRHARPAALSPAESQVRSKLEAVGVDWDQPLSAGDYRSWHDRQSEVRDQVERTGRSELTLTTTLEAGDVAQESITVREDDFHPIRRVVEMRDRETFEVAELDYAVLGWNVVNQALFEPFPELVDGEPVGPLASLHAVVPRALPLPMEIDVAELAARAALTQLGSDAGDQIRITHSDAGVVVKGIVATNQRKRQLVTRLDQIALVRAEFLSAEGMQSRPMNGATGATGSMSGLTVQTVTASNELAPLATYLNDRQAPRDQLSTTSKQILDASLQVQQAGSQLLELQERFKALEVLPEASRKQLESLIIAQQNEISAGLAAELSALAQVGLAVQDYASTQTESSPANRTALQYLIAQNQQYCQELIAAPVNEPRPVSAVSADIQSSIRQIRASLAEMSNSSPQP